MGSGQYTSKPASLEHSFVKSRPHFSEPILAYSFAVFSKVPRRGRRSPAQATTHVTRPPQNCRIKLMSSFICKTTNNATMSSPIDLAIADLGKQAVPNY
jgi:hypothetical protein